MYFSQAGPEHQINWVISFYGAKVFFIRWSCFTRLFI